jgi:hypothetical protein
MDGLVSNLVSILILASCIEAELDGGYMMKNKTFYFVVI